MTPAPPDLEQIKKSLKEKGWSYRTACIFCGVSFSHFSKVLNGLHHSEKLLNAIQAMPVRRAFTPRTHGNKKPPHGDRRRQKRIVPENIKLQRSLHTHFNPHLAHLYPTSM